MALENNETRHGEKHITRVILSRWLWTGTMLIAGAVAALSFVYIIQRGSPPPAVPSPLTSLEGSEMDPALSPDGQRKFDPSIAERIVASGTYVCPTISAGWRPIRS